MAKVKAPTQKYVDRSGQADRGNFGLAGDPGREAPPAPSGPPAPAAGDGQGGAAAKKNKRRAKKANIEAELFRAIVNLDFARTRLEAARQLNPPFEDSPTDEDAELLRLRRADHVKAWLRINTAARRAINAIPEDNQ